MSPGSHGTHVASIAAGNRGVAREARHRRRARSRCPRRTSERRRSFYDSSRIAHAVDYLLERRRELGTCPVSINISLGTNGHAHDDSSARSAAGSTPRWPSRAAASASPRATPARSAPRRAATSAASWAASTRAGRSRRAGSSPTSSGTSSATASPTSPRTSSRSGTAPQDRFAVQVKPPGGGLDRADRAGRVHREPRSSPTARFLSVYNELYHPANGANYIAIYLSPQLREAERGRRAGRAVAGAPDRPRRPRRPLPRWIERDDPRRVGRDRRARRVGVPVVLLGDAPSSTARRSARSPAASGSSRWPTSTRRGGGSTSPAARARPATAARSRTSPRPAPTSSPPTGFADRRRVGRR